MLSVISASKYFFGGREARWQREYVISGFEQIEVLNPRIGLFSFSAYTYRECTAS